MTGGEEELEKETAEETLENYRVPTANRGGKRDKMGTLHKALKHVVRPLSSCSKIGFRADTWDDEKHVFFSVINSYYCDFAKGKDLYGFMHGNSAKRPCISCTKSIEYIERLVQIKERTLEMTAGVTLYIENIKEYPDGCSQAEVSEFVKQNGEPSPFMLLEPRLNTCLE